jgi:hypothetical protein
VVRRTRFWVSRARETLDPFSVGRSGAGGGDLRHFFLLRVVPHRRHEVEIEGVCHRAAHVLEQDRRAYTAAAGERNSFDDVERLPTIRRDGDQGITVNGVARPSTYERSPNESVADSAPSSLSQAWTISTTPMTVRDSHSEATRTSFRDRSNEIDERSKSLASRRTSSGTRVSSSTATRISTNGPPGSKPRRRPFEVGWIVLQPALLRMDRSAVRLL